MVSGFADFLKDTLTDNVKGLLKPANWLVSAIFVVLNLVFVFPTLIDENILSPTNIFITNSSLQLVASVVLVLLIAYVLSSTKKSIFLFIAGNLQLLPSQSSEKGLASQTKTEIDERAKEAIKQQKNNKSLEFMITNPDKNKQNPLSGKTQNVAAQGQTSAESGPSPADAEPHEEQASSSALVQTIRNKVAKQKQENVTVPSSKEPLLSAGSTLLGSDSRKHTLLNRTEYEIRQRIERQWGVNWDSLNRHFEGAISAEVEWNRVNNEQEALDFFISLTFILVLFASEDILVQFFWREGLSIAWGWVFLGIAYITYRLAVSKMRAWGEALEHTITMHRETLRQEFGLRSFDNVDDEKALWQAVSQWIYSKGKDIPDNILPRQLISTPSNKNVKVEIYPDTVDMQNPEWKSEINGSTKYIQKVYQEINYVILVSNIGVENNSPSIKDIYIPIFDSQVPIILSAPVVELIHDSSNATQDNGVAQNQSINNKILCMVISADSGNVQFPTRVIPVKPIYHHKPRQLLLHISDLASNSSIPLKYSLPSRLSRITVSDVNLEITAESVGSGSTTSQQQYLHTITIKNGNNDNKSIKIDLFDNQTSINFEKSIIVNEQGKEEPLSSDKLAPRHLYSFPRAIEKNKSLVLKLNQGKRDS